MLFIIPCWSWFWLLYDSLAGYHVNNILLICDGSVAFCAGFCSWFTIFQMCWISLYRDVEIAILTIFRFFIAFCFMGFEISWREGFLAVRALFLPMELLVMLFLEVDVIHLMAGGTLFDVPSAVSIVSCHFALGVFLETVVAAFHFLTLHDLEFV